MFTPGSPLGELAHRAAGRVDLAGRLRAGLAPELAAQLLGASVREDGTLVLLASTPAWAARLRFEGERLLGLCADLEQPAQRVKVRVGTDVPPRDPPAGPG